MNNDNDSDKGGSRQSPRGFVWHPQVEPQLHPWVEDEVESVDAAQVESAPAESAPAVETIPVEVIDIVEPAPEAADAVDTDDVADVSEPLVEVPESEAPESEVLESEVPESDASEEGNSSDVIESIEQEEQVLSDIRTPVEIPLAKSRLTRSARSAQSVVTRASRRARLFVAARVFIAAVATVAVFITLVSAGFFGPYRFGGDGLPGSPASPGGAAEQHMVAFTPLTGNIDSLKSIDPAQAQAAIDALTPYLGGTNSYGVVIADGQGKIVAQKNLDKALEPASALKTLTALAAVMSLDMDATLDTSVRARIDATDGSAVLELKGGGDMLLGSGKSDPNHINGRAGLQTLTDHTVAALKKAGVTKVVLHYDDSLFGSDRMPATMDPQQVTFGNYTPISSMAVNEGKSSIDYPQGNPDGLPTSYPPRSQDPARDVATLFARQLKVAGIDVGNVIGNAVGQQTASSAGDDSSAGNGASIATVHSAPLSQILRLTLQQSDNTLIEEFGRLVALAQKAPNSPAGATKAVLATVKRTGVDTEGTNMADCSGLSSGSRVSVNTLVDVQEKFLNDADAAAVEGLSVVGVSGTAFEHQFTRKSAGLVRLKTGTLSGVTSMAGNVVRRGGGILYFAIIINDAPQMWDAGAGLDRFADSLVDL